MNDNINNDGSNGTAHEPWPLAPPESAARPSLRLVPPPARPRRRMPSLPAGSGSPPMFNVPPGVKSLVMLLFVIHLAQEIMPAGTNARLESLLGYYPYSYWLLLHHHWAGPLFLVVVTPLTYMFLHAGWMHLAVNVMSLTAFGSGVERIAGARTMVWLFLLCGVAGAFTEFAFDPRAQDIIIGASAGISGLFAIAFLSLIRQQNPSRRKIVMLICLMIVVMAITGKAGMQGMHVAWVAHIGGFLAGLLADATLSHRDGKDHVRDVWWFAAMIALPLFVAVVSISRYF